MDGWFTGLQKMMIVLWREEEKKFLGYLFLEAYMMNFTVVNQLQVKISDFKPVSLSS